MSPEKQHTVPIPEPRGLPILGNVGEFKSEDSIQDLERLHHTYGDIFRLQFPGQSYVFVGSQKLVNELCDETRFKKSVRGEVAEARMAAGDGLFTAHNEEENWALAHRILMPAFGPVNIQTMFDEMYDLASQMALKWARHGSSHPISVCEDFTRLALDTLALCSMGYRFNSFYKDEMHPFVKSMTNTLLEFGNRAGRPRWTNIFYRSAERELLKDVELMRQTSRELIRARRCDMSGTPRKDLLDAMLDGVDKRTGKKLSDESIINNLVTFLVAGHETTSGTLAFVFYSLMKNPHTYQRAQKEVDTIMGRERINVDRLFKLKYIPAVLRETLRQCSPIPGITFEALEDSLMDEKYPVKKGEPIVAIFSQSHIDPRVFGEDAREFRPERMMDENFERLQREFPNCWKPFGNGMRACIGRPFAWQEMLLATSLLLQNFDFRLDPSYTLKIAETLTIKPKDLIMRATLRHGMSILEFERHIHGESSVGRNAPSQERSTASLVKGIAGGMPMSIFYGSNSGTCEALARRLALNAPAHGFRASTVESLDAVKGGLPTDQPVILLLSSYEGQPPDNAKHFVAWLEGLREIELDNVNYAVFGAGNSEWRQTFHRIPKLVDDAMEKHGATRIAPLGSTDVSERDPFSDFESWEDKLLWPALGTQYSVTKPTDDEGIASLVVDVSSAMRTSTLRQNVSEAVVTVAKDLTGPGTPRKRHIEMRLPTGMSYEPGDYLMVLPMNPRETVSRATRRLGLSPDSTLTVSGNEGTLLPLGKPITALDLLSSYVELSQPATKKNVQVLANAVVGEEGLKKELTALAAGDTFEEEVTQKRVSVLDLLERYPSVELPVGVFLAMLPPMRIRQYSISSSPLHDPRHASLTYSILEEPSLAGQGTHIGVATSYLASLCPGDRLQVSTRASHVAFHLPRDPESTPIICIAAGAGLAPFRGFIQERVAQINAGRTLAPALLIYGCRGRADDMYRDDFYAWEAAGAVTIKRTYSRASDSTDGCRYVQDRMRKDKELLFELWEAGAKLFVCGSRKVGNAVEEACVELLAELKETDRASARDLLDKIRNERFATDVFD